MLALETAGLDHALTRDWLRGLGLDFSTPGVGFPDTRKSDSPANSWMGLGKGRTMASQADVGITTSCAHVQPRMYVLPAAKGCRCETPQPGLQCD